MSKAKILHNYRRTVKFIFFFFFNQIICDIPVSKYLREIGTPFSEIFMSLIISETIKANFMFIFILSGNKITHK